MKELAAVAVLVSVFYGLPQVAQDQAEEVLANAARAYEGVVTLRSEFVQKIDIPALEELSTSRRQVRPFVEEFVLENGRAVHLLGDGRLINLAAAEGHPASVMDMSFANQALCAEHMARHAGELEKRVYGVPREIDEEISKLKLGSLGIGIDTLTPEQEKYLSSWDQGT